MMRLKPLLIIIGVVLIIGGSVAGWILSHSQRPAKQAGATYPVSVANLDNTPDKLTDTRITMIKTYVSAAVTAKHGDGNYDAAYREGSYRRTVTPEGGVINTALIDVTSTKETYLVTWTGGDNARNSSSYVRCAPEADQIVHPSVCKELAND